MNARASTLLVVLAVLATACAGPREPLDVGVREVANDIVLGTQGQPKKRAPVAPPIPPAPVAVNILTPTVLPPPRPPLPRPEPEITAPPVEECPRANPLDVPTWGAPDTEGTPPVEEAFTFRNDGTYSVAGANAFDGEYEQEAARELTELVVEDGGNFTYDLAAQAAGTSTISSYLMRNERPVDDGFGVGDQAGVDQQRGFYLTAVTTIFNDGTELTFEPRAPMRLLRFPIFAGDSFDEVGTDPLTGTTMTWTSTVVGQTRVDACGELISAWQVELTDGRVESLDASVEFSATYDIATQYGGLIVRDTVVSSGREGNDTVTRTNTATISRVPTHVTEAEDAG